MFASNHALTGALIGLSVSNPVLAMPLAFASHFALDAIPHYGREDNDEWLRNPWFHRLLVAEALFCFVIVTALAVSRPQNWLMGAVCAFIAVSPDLFWVKQFIRGNKGKVPISPKHNWFLDFHTWVQWFEKPKGIYIEMPVFTLLVLLFGYKIF